jgi:hypothetical protein
MIFCSALTKKHDLKDALRRWLALHPDEMNQLRASKPSGPLAVTHRTGRRRNSPGTDRRFDSVWVSRAQLGASEATLG